MNHHENKILKEVKHKVHREDRRQHRGPCSFELHYNIRLNFSCQIYNAATML